MHLYKSFLKNITQCSLCASPALRMLHSSPLIFKWPNVMKPVPAEREKRKSIKIWESMTVWDLAKSLKKDLNYVENVLKPQFTSDPISGRITNLSSVCEFLKRENLRFTILKHALPKHNIKNEEIVTVEEVNKRDTCNLVKRAPVVTIMGHVDHGKTTLLDALRNSNIVDKEFGGITQHIGAFSVSINQKKITFIDTPGHAAFSSMRNRGAELTDLVVLIVAADDGVMEQTVESIKMARNAGVRILVAINKIDMAPRDLTSIKQQLLEEGVQAEDLGGDVQVIPISALKRKNLDLLIEAISLEADLLELVGDPGGPVEGVVIESSIGPKGRVATVLVKNGTIRKRMLLLAGTAMARVRAIFGEDGSELSEITLSQAAQIIGWRVLPNAGDRVIDITNQKDAQIAEKNKKKNILQQKVLSDYEAIQKKRVQHHAEYFERKQRIQQYKRERSVENLKNLFSEKKVVIEEDKVKLGVIIKGDVDGSVDAILNVLATYNCNDLCKLNIITHGVGKISENDIDLAEMFNAVIFCFNLPYPQDLKEKIAEKGINVKFHNVIYKMIDDLKQEIYDKLPGTEEDNVIGTAEVLQHFTVDTGRKKTPVAGTACLTGELHKDKLFKVIRNGHTIFEGASRSLRHFKNEVNVVKKNQQCGIMLEDFTGEYEQGDKIICFEKILVHKPIPWNPGF